MQNGEMVVKVSGQAVYNAVKNYLNNNELLQKEISDAVQELVINGHIKAQVDQMITTEMNGYRMRRIMEDSLSKLVAQKVQEEIQNAVKQALAKAVFVVPNQEK